MSYKIPILFLVFNRLDTVKVVFEKIREIKPMKLYVACDGSREEKKGEKEKVDQVRKYILDNITWECEVKKLFRDENLGCKKAVSSAIDWFFLNEEMGVILEDDCLPNNSFFYFCEECLEKYKNDEQIFQIAGNSYINKEKISESYFFSKYAHIWGWATWRRAWKKYEIENKNFIEDFEKVSSIFNSKIEREYWKKTLQSYFDGQINTWDYPWVFTIWKNNGCVIYPKYNMVRNIGMGHVDAVHTTDDNPRISKAQLYEIGEIVHPNKIEVNRKLDRIAFIEAYYYERKFFVKIKRRLRRRFNKMLGFLYKK